MGDNLRERDSEIVKLFGTLRRVKSEEVWNLHAYRGRRKDTLISHQEIKGEIRADP